MNILNSVKSYIFCYFSLSYLVFACESCKINRELDKGKTSSESHKKKFIPNSEIDQTSFMNDEQNKMLHKKLKDKFNAIIDIEDNFLWDLMYNYASGKCKVFKTDEFSNLEEVVSRVLDMKVKIANNKKAEEILNKIENNLLFKVFTKDEVKRKIIELNFDKNQVDNYINDCILKINYATSLFKKEDLTDNDDLKYYTFVRVIIEQNKTKEEIAEMIEEYNDKSKHVPVQPVKNVADLTEAELTEEIFNELEDGYNFTSLKEKEEIIEKIKELKCNRDEIYKWVEAVISGEA